MLCAINVTCLLPVIGTDFFDPLIQLRNQPAQAGVGRDQTDRGNRVSGRFQAPAQ